MSIEQSITGGLVSVEDGIKASEEYAPARKVRVELSFDGSGGSPQDVLDHVAALATAKVNELLGRTVAPKVTTTTTTPTAASPGKPKVTAKAKVEPEPKPAETATVEDDELGLGGTPKPASAGVDMSDTGAETSDDLSFLNAPEETKEITDADLNDQVQKKHRELMEPKLIRDLLESFNPEPGKKVIQLRDVPQASRQAFLDKLHSLKKSA